MVAVSHPSLASLAHRPWPIPAGGWIMAQSWRDLLFAHWRTDAGYLASLLPAGLALDTHDGQAWVGIVPFRMHGTRLRGLPPLPGTHAFPELNVRTYVTDGSKPGVWFFSLDAASALAVRVARTWFRLPYFDARMSCAAVGDGIEYESARTHSGAPPASFRARYGPAGPVYLAEPGTLEHWLTARYCLYASRRRGLLRGEIHHEPWPLQPARADITEDTLAASWGIETAAEPPLLHFVRRIDVVCWPPTPRDGRN